MDCCCSSILVWVGELVNLSLANPSAHVQCHFTTGVAKPLTQIEPGNVEHHSTSLNIILPKFELHVQADTNDAEYWPWKLHIFL